METIILKRIKIDYVHMSSGIGGRGSDDLIYNPYTGDYETYEVALKRKMNQLYDEEKKSKN